MIGQADTPRLILASASVTRAMLLTASGLAFEAIAAHVDEAEVKRSARAEGLDAAETALLLAELKAQRLSRRYPDAVVIGCDQLLICGDDWFDKPTDVAAARVQLQALRGKTHTLVTAILCQRGDTRLWHHVATPKLHMRQFSDSFLEAYLAAEGDAVTSTVGGYRLEGVGVTLFDSIDGEHAAILGVPLLALLGFLRQHAVLTA